MLEDTQLSLPQMNIFHSSVRVLLPVSNVSGLPPLIVVHWAAGRSYVELTTVQARQRSSPMQPLSQSCADALATMEGGSDDSTPSMGSRRYIARWTREQLKDRQRVVNQ